MALKWHHPALEIDFAGPSFARRLNRTRVVSLVAGVVGLLAVGLAVDDAFDLLRQHETVDAELTVIGQQIVVVTRSRPVASRLALGMPEADDINAKIARLNLPWSELFQALESATPTNVSLLEITPDARKRTVTGVAEVAGSEDMLRYMSRLGSQPFFSSVVLSRHETNLTDPNKPLRFHFTAQWERATK